MIDRKTGLAVALALLLVIYFLVGSGKAPRLWVASARVKDPTKFAAPDFTLKVDFDSRLPEPQATLHQQARDRLNQARIEAPEERSRYFQTTMHPEHLARIGGWRGMIESITPIENGIVVELSVTAVFGGMFDATTLLENYSIINGEVRYLGAHVPKDIVTFSVGF